MTAQQVGGPEAAVFDFARGGPQWGAGDLARPPPPARATAGPARRGPRAHRNGATPAKTAALAMRGQVIGAPAAPVMGGFAGPDTPTQGAGDLRTAKSRLGLAYAALPAGAGQASLLGGAAAAARLAEVEVFISPALAALY